MKPPEIDWDKIHEIIEKHKGDRWGLIPLLQEVQEHTGYKYRSIPVIFRLKRSNRSPRP
jgi:NADH:ubiquinone oxidoreductase subunit E